MNKHPVRMEQDVLSFLQLFAAQLPACGIDVRPMFPTDSATDFLFAPGDRPHGALHARVPHRESCHRVGGSASNIERASEFLEVRLDERDVAGLAS